MRILCYYGLSYFVAYPAYVFTMVTYAFHILYAVHLSSWSIRAKSFTLKLQFQEIFLLAFYHSIPSYSIFYMNKILLKTSQIREFTATTRGYKVWYLHLQTQIKNVGLQREKTD